MKSCGAPQELCIAKMSQRINLPISEKLFSQDGMSPTFVWLTDTVVARI
jgi:hypothetical protein